MRKVYRVVLVSFLIAASGAVPIAAGVVAAAPAGASPPCAMGDVVLVSASFTPNPVAINATTFQNDVTLTNCTSSSQMVDFGGTVSAPSGTCGGGDIAFGPIGETLTANQVLDVTQTIGQAPGCPGTYTQIVNVTQGMTQLSTTTVTFVAH